MHADEFAIDSSLVRRLVDGQFPQWAELPIERVELAGTENVLYRLGDDLVVRLPRMSGSGPTLEKERRWLPRLGPHLPLAIPRPVAQGSPAQGYPFDWLVNTWLPGERATADRIADERVFTADLAGFISALQRIDTTEAPGPGEHNGFRGEAVARRDAATRAAIATLRDSIDGPAIAAVWDEACRASPWRGRPVWIHGDLDRQNMLVVDGRLSGVIDFGTLAVGDPACDVMVAWKVLSADTRKRFRQMLEIDDATWARSRGWAVSQAVIALEYYTDETHPVLVRESRRWLAAVTEPG